MVSSESSSADYNKWSYLGSVCGGMGAVWAAKHKSTSENVAVKVYNLDKCEEEMELIQDEISRVRQLRHPNIVPYLSSFISGQELWVIMPLLGYTSAARLVASKFQEGLNEQAIVYIVKDVLQGLHYLHSKGIIHRAIKGSHIQISSEGSCCLTGLRHSTTRVTQGKWLNAVHSYPSQAKYNLNWLSPEVLEQDLLGYSEKSDIYSLGIVICELANGEVPYSRAEEATFMFLEKFEGAQPFIYDATSYEECFGNVDALSLCTDASIGESTREHLMNISEHKRFSHSAHQFVEQTLTRRSSKRPSADQLLHHQFIKQTRKFHTSLRQILNQIIPLTSEASPGDNGIPDLLEEDLDQMSINEDTTWEFE